MAKSRAASTTSSWKSKQAGKAPSRAAAQGRMAMGRKGGGYMSDRNMDFNKNQTIEELTGGRIKKSK